MRRACLLEKGLRRNWLSVGRRCCCCCCLQGEYTVGAQGTETMLNSLMYRTSYYDFGKVRDWEAGVGQLQGSQVVAGSVNACHGGTDCIRLLQHWTHAAQVLCCHPPSCEHALMVPHHAHSVLVANAWKGYITLRQERNECMPAHRPPPHLPAPCTVYIHSAAHTLGRKHNKCNIIIMLANYPSIILLTNNYYLLITNYLLLTRNL